MWLRESSYKPEPAPFKVGQWVYFEERRYQVEACSHTHVQLKGRLSAVAAWQCSRRLRISTDPMEYRKSVDCDRDPQYLAAKD